MRKTDRKKNEVDSQKEVRGRQTERRMRYSRQTERRMRYTARKKNKVDRQKEE